MLSPVASLATIWIWSPRYILVMTPAVAELAFPLAAPAAATMRSGRMPTRTRVPLTAWPRPRTTIPAPASMAKPPSAASATSPARKFMSPMKSATNGVSGRS